MTLCGAKILRDRIVDTQLSRIQNTVDVHLKQMNKYAHRAKKLLVYASGKRWQRFIFGTAAFCRCLCDGSQQARRWVRQVLYQFFGWHASTTMASMNGTVTETSVNKEELVANGLPVVPQNVLDKFTSEWDTLEQDHLCSSDYYFNSYAHFAIHEEMLKDRVRTGSYHAAIMNNRHLFKDKVVLDVGSGTGILSLFAAKAGAAHVYGIECSEIIDIATKIAAKNGLADKITFIKGKAEDVVLPVDKVDIIVSEWMGYMLLYESMLDTVLLMRDKYLTKDGLVFPDKASLHIAAIEDGEYREEKIGYWGNVYGFDYSCVKKCIMEEPIVDVVEEVALTTTSCCVLQLDLKTCRKEDLDFCAPYHIELTRRDFVHAMVLWFDITFSACHKPISFSTGPASTCTHWKQTVLYLDDVLMANENESIDGLIAVRKNAKNQRDLDIKLSYEFNGQQGPVKNSQCYRMR